MAAAGPVTEEGVVVSLAGEANQGGRFWRPQSKNGSQPQERPAPCQLVRAEGSGGFAAAH